jgi:flagellin-like protein
MKELLHGSVNRRGQGSEIVGLLVIIVFIIVGALLYLRLGSFSSVESSFADIRASTEAYNLLKAMMAVNIGEPLDALSYRCYSGDCRAFEERLRDMIGASLPEGKSHWFSLEAEGQPLFVFGDCRVGIIGSYPFRYEGVFFEARLRVCT